MHHGLFHIIEQKCYMWNSKQKCYMSHKAKTFAVLDLTQGYHQAPLTLAARVYTAFILSCGVYQFTRLTFGPKRAPSYFQQTMATVVLAGLIYIICEMYIPSSAYCRVFGYGK
jgi:hypothetical protein